MLELDFKKIRVDSDDLKEKFKIYKNLNPTSTFKTDITSKEVCLVI